MKKKKLQEMINKPDCSPKRMRMIGESYIRGEILYDPVAAEAWLMLAVRQGESEEAVRAMELIARVLHRQEKVLSDEDYVDIWRELQKADPKRQKYLEKLLELGTEAQQELIKNVYQICVASKTYI